MAEGEDGHTRRLIQETARFSARLLLRRAGEAQDRTNAGLQRFQESELVQDPVAWCTTPCPPDAKKKSYTN